MALFVQNSKQRGVTKCRPYSLCRRTRTRTDRRSVGEEGEKESCGSRLDYVRACPPAAPFSRRTGLVRIELTKQAREKSETNERCNALFALRNVTCLPSSAICVRMRPVASREGEKRKEKKSRLSSIRWPSENKQGDSGHPIFRRPLTADS